VNPTVLSVIALITALGGMTGFVALFTVRPSRTKIMEEARKTGADASKVIADTATLLLEPLKIRVAELQAEVTTLRTEATDLRVSLLRERTAAEQRIRQLEADVASRDAELSILRQQVGHVGGEHGVGTQSK